MNNAVAGFSKFIERRKINWIAKEYFSTPTEAIKSAKETIGILDEKIQNYTMNLSRTP
jgi:hydroxymethylglutaryl-CoA reductase